MKSPKKKTLPKMSAMPKRLRPTKSTLPGSPPGGTLNEYKSQNKPPKVMLPVKMCVYVCVCVYVWNNKHAFFLKESLFVFFFVTAYKKNPPLNSFAANNWDSILFLPSIISSVQVLGLKPSALAFALVRVKLPVVGLVAGKLLVMALESSTDFASAMKLSRMVV